VTSGPHREARPVQVLHVAPTVSVSDGPSRAILTMLRALENRTDVEFQLLTGMYRGLKLSPALSLYPPAQVEVLRVFQPLGGRLGFSVAYPPGFQRSLSERARAADIVHMHGLWLYPTLVGCRLLRALKRPYVISLYGSLMADALRRSHLKKVIALGTVERRNIEAAAAVIATSQQELIELDGMGFSTSGVVIPLAMDAAAMRSLAEGRSREGFLARSERTVLCVSRFHSQKRLVELVEAFGNAAGSAPNWHLRLVGPDHEPGYRTKVMAVASASGAADRISVEPALESEMLWKAYRDADLFVLASTFEGFGLVIGEALAAGLPAIATRDAPWPQLRTERCGWWIDSSLESLRSTLIEAMSLEPATLWEMGTRGRSVIANEFSLDALGRRLAETYSSSFKAADRR
jgi:glycosyltransferase involved in cell wall biosynthesis